MALIDNIVSYYKLDEASGNAVDAHTSSHDLTETGTIASQTGIIDTARGTYGSGTRFRKASVLSLSESQSFSVSGWIYVTSTPSVNNFVLAGGASGNDNFGFWIRVTTAGNLDFSIIKEAVAIKATVAKAVTNTTWHHFIATYNGSTREMQLSLNDDTPTTDTPTADTYNADAALIMGAHPSAFDQTGTNIYTDEFGYWSRVLTSTEFTELYNSGNGLTYPFISFNPAIARRKVLLR